MNVRTVAVYAVLAIVTLAGVPDPASAAPLSACFQWTPDPVRCSHRPTFDAACTYAGDGETITLFEWDLNGDGTYEQSGATMDSIQLGHDLDSFATVSYSLQVTNSAGETLSVTHDIAPLNRQPTAVANGPYAIEEGNDLVLDASGSSSNDSFCGDAITEYAWDVVDVGGGAAEAVGASVTQTVPWSQVNGWGLTLGQSYDLRLTVTDSEGGTQTVLTTVVVYKKDPVARFDMLVDGQVITNTTCGTDVTFDPSDSFHPSPNRDIVEWEWDWENDGTYDLDDTTGDPQIHAFSTFGAQTIKLRVTDDAGNPSSATVTKTLTIDNRSPVSDAGAS